jgi:hypothetical protein
VGDLRNASNGGEWAFANLICNHSSRSSLHVDIGTTHFPRMNGEIGVFGLIRCSTAISKEPRIFSAVGVHEALASSGPVGGWNFGDAEITNLE